MKVLFSNPPWWIENPDAIYAPKLMAGVRAGSRWPFTTVVRSRPGDFQFGIVHRPKHSEFFDKYAVFYFYS